jgi:hypothetical protein
MRLETVLEQISSKGTLKWMAKAIDVFDASQSSLDQLRELVLIHLGKGATVTALWDSLTMREKLVLMGLLQHAGSRAVPIGEVYSILAKYFDDVRAEASTDAAIEGVDRRSAEAYKNAVRVALSDGRMTPDERAVLDAFREGIGMTHHQEILAYSQLGLFENMDQRAVMNEILPGLTRRGLLFEIGTGRIKNHEPSLVIPFEVVRSINSLLGLGLSNRNLRRFLEAVPRDLLERLYESSGLPNTRGPQRMVEKLVRAEYPLARLLDLLDKRGLRALCYRAGYRPSGQGKREQIAQILDYASIDDPEDFGSGVLLDEQLSGEKVEQLIRHWKDADAKNLTTVLTGHLIPTSTHAAKLASNILESRVPIEDLLGHSQVNADLVVKLVEAVGERVMRSKSDNLRKLLVYLNDTDRDLISHLNLVASRDVASISKQGYAYHNDELPNLFERLTKYVFDSVFDVEVARHPRLMSLDGREHFPDGVIGMNERRVVLWDNKACAEEYEITTNGRRPHFDQFKGYVEAFRRTHPDKELLALVIITGAYSQNAIRAARRLKEETNCDVCLLSAENLALIAELGKKANEAARRDLNLFNLTGDLEATRIHTRLAV